MLLRLAGVGAAVPLLLIWMQAAQLPAADILGTWHGTSTCVDRARDTACADEDVIYEVDSAAGAGGPVRMRADKIVNGVRQNMGELSLQYDASTHAWSADIKTRMTVRWSFEPKGDAMAGTLAELPSGRIMRRVAVRRALR